MKKKGFTLWMWASVWMKVVGQIGMRGALRSARNQLEEKLASRGDRVVMRVTRAWYALGAAAGVALVAAASPPRMAGPAVDVGSVAVFAAVAGAGVALGLRSIAMLLATYSGNLLVHRFHVSLKPSLIRAALITMIGTAAWQFPWPISGWVALSLAAIAWTVYPMLLHAVIAARAPRHISHRMLPMDQILSMSARSLPPEARKQIAIHEAGHAVFFGLGESVPEDLYTWLDDEIPPLEDIAAGQRQAAGAVSAFTALTEKAIALDLHRKELLVLLGMLCGGAAAETVVYGDPSAGMVMDAAAFEAKARLFLALYPDSRWPYFIDPATELEVRANATSLGAFRDYLLEQSQQFLLVNRAALDRVAEALLEKGELDVENLRRLLSGVMPAAGFERFTWPADVPAMQYLP